MIIAIDGPAGSGKSTIAREVATRFGFSNPASLGSLRGRRLSRSSSEKAERTRSSACSPRSFMPSSPCIVAGSANCGSVTWLKALGGNSPTKRSRRSNLRRGRIYRRIA